MSEADLLTPAQAKKRGSRRRWLLVAVLALLPVLLLATLYLYVGHLADVDLQEALAEADHLDPGWRLDDLLQQPRPEYAADDNSALQVIRAKALFPTGWGAKKELNDLLNDLFAFPPRPQQLDPEQQRVLGTEMARAAAAVAEARKVADMPHGHFPTEYTHQDWIRSFHLVNYSQDARTIVLLLQYDTLLLAQEGNTDDALRSIRAIVNIGWSVGDEPPWYLALNHIYCRGFAARGLQRVLSQGEPSPAALADLQRLLEEEEAVNLLLCYARGKRAAMDHLMMNVQNGSATMAQLLGSVNLSVGWRDPEVTEVGLIKWSPGGLKSQRAAILRCLTRLVESAKRAPTEQAQQIKQLEAESRNNGLLIRALVPQEIKIVESNRRDLTLLRSAIVALAAERYRGSRNAWPASLDTLVADSLLKRVPADPYDGAPLRYRVCDDRVVIYSIGRDLEDNGGTFDSKWGYTKGTDVGFTLWNVSHRRLLPLPAAEPIPDEPNAGPQPDAAPPPAPKETDK
jgi:hypothetical protein